MSNYMIENQALQELAVLKWNGAALPPALRLAMWSTCFFA